MPEAERESVRRLILEVWGGGNLSLLDTLVDPEVVARYGALRDPLVGIGAYREFLGAYQTLLGQIAFTIDEQLEDGDKVVTRWTVRPADSPEDPGTMGISIHRVAAGRIVESWVAWDSESVAEQLGSTDVLETLDVSL